MGVLFIALTSVCNEVRVHLPCDPHTDRMIKVPEVVLILDIRESFSYRKKATCERATEIHLIH